jgi:hypothetical protein
VRLAERDAGLVVERDLAITGRTRPVMGQLDVGGGGRVRGTVALTKSAWEIKPYRGLLGARKVRDEPDIVIEARLPGAT